MSNDCCPHLKAARPLSLVTQLIQLHTPSGKARAHTHTHAEKQHTQGSERAETHTLNRAALLGFYSGSLICGVLVSPSLCVQPALPRVTEGVLRSGTSVSVLRIKLQAVSQGLYHKKKSNKQRFGPFGTAAGSQKKKMREANVLHTSFTRYINILAA